MKIICGTCTKTIAEDTDPAEAAEIAEFDCEASQHPESDEWTCAGCQDAELAYWGAQMPVLRAEAEVREQAADPIAYWNKTKGI